MCVTDLGRRGHSRMGIPVNGAADQYSARAANILAGNTEHAPLLEITSGSCSMRVLRPVLISITGALADVRADGVPYRQWSPIVLRGGQMLEISNIRDGFRVYVAVNGLIEARYRLGSCAPDPLIGLEGDLHPGDVIRVRSGFRGYEHPPGALPLFRPLVSTRRIASRRLVPLIEGGDSRYFPGAFQTLLSNEYVVGSRSDHVGLRLEGDRPDCSAGEELKSRGVPIGGVEVAPRDLFLLLRGVATTAGYPVIAVVPRHAHGRLGQIGPGDRLSFVPSSLKAAVEAYRAQRLELQSLHIRMARLLRTLDLAWD